MARAAVPMADCALCQRSVQKVSRHHLIPKSRGGKHTPTVPLCQPCHSTLHCTLSNKELASTYPTVEKLRLAPELQPYLSWVKDRAIERISNKRKRR